MPLSDGVAWDDMSGASEPAAGREAVLRMLAEREAAVPQSGWA